MSTGTLVAIIGAALAAILAGIGSAYGVRLTGQAAAGVTAEKPDLFGKLLVIEALPGTQAFTDSWWRLSSWSASAFLAAGS